MATTSSGGNPIVLGAVLIVGAMIWSRSQTARAQSVRPGQVGSMPGSAGTGAAQVAGGIVGSILNAFRNTNTTLNWSTWNPINPDDGQSYNPANPGQLIGTQDLVNGTIHDYYTNDRSSYSIPTTTDIFESVTGSGGGSIIRNPDAYW